MYEYWVSNYDNGGYITERNCYSVVPKVCIIQRWGFLFVFLEERRWILHYSNSNCEVTVDALSTSVNQC